MVPNIYTGDEIVRTLRSIQRCGFHSALIAGGAVRDLYFRQMPRDIDIFVHDPELSPDFEDAIPTLTHEFWENVLGSTHDDGRISSDSIQRCDLGTYTDSDITAIWSALKNYIPYQIILTKIPPAQYVEDNFDIGLCKAYCDGTKFRFTPDFMHDMRHRTMTIVAKNLDRKRMHYTLREHLPRIQPRYPGYTTVAAPWNEKLYQEVTKRVNSSWR